VETHAHLDDGRFQQDLEQTLARAAAAGVACLGQVFLSPDAWEAGRERFPSAPGRPEVFFLLGIHPAEAHTFPPDVLDRIRTIFVSGPQASRLRAVGEIGLDYHWKGCPVPVQKDFFRRQLRLARDLGLPAVIHCREAEMDALALLLAEGFAGRPLLWHCFGGDRDLALRIVEAGWHLSIPGTVTYPANEALRGAVAAVPEDRLLVETDCPYLAPHPLRGQRNEPAFLGYTIAAMAKARGTDPASLWAACGENARRFFRLGRPDSSNSRLKML
jgi:TatD DNase family protein